MIITKNIIFMTKLSKFTALAISLLIHLSAYASIEMNGLFYELNSDAATAKVVPNPDNTKYVGDIVVPATIEYDSKTYNVTSVGESFINSPELTSLFLSKNCVSCEGVYGCSELKSFEWDVTEELSNQMVFSSKNNFINGCNKLERLFCPNSTVSTSYFVTAIKAIPTITEIRFPRISFQSESLAKSKFKSIDLSFVKQLGTETFANCDSLTTVALPDSYIFSGSEFYTFYGCKNLASFKLPESTKFIPEGFLMGCGNLNNLNFPNSLEEIHSQALTNTKAGHNATLNEGLKRIANDALALTGDVKIPSTLEFIGNNLNSSLISSISVADGSNYFKAIDNILYSADEKTIYASATANASTQNWGIIKNNNVETIKSMAFLNAPISGFDFPALKTVESAAFRNTNMASVTIKNGITYESSVFWGNRQLTEVIIEDGVNSLPEYMFYYCDKLETAPTLPESIISIGSSCFGFCNFKSIELGRYLRSIGYGVLPDCITHVTCKAPIPPTNTRSTDSYLANVTLTVPMGCVDSYKSHPYWNQCKEIIGDENLSSEMPNQTLPDGIYFATKDGNIKFYDNGNIYDTHINSGAHPFNMQVYNNNIYVTDAGEIFTYTNSSELGDGCIYRISQINDSIFYKEVIIEAGNTNNFDPYNCWIDNSIGTLYTTNRNQSVDKIDLNTFTPNAYTTATTPKLVKEWSYLPYYNRGIAYAAITTGFQRDKNGINWQAFNYNGQGIYRYNDSDIKKNASNYGDTPFGIIASDAKPSAMYIDETNGYLYIYEYGYQEGLYRISLDKLSDATSRVSIRDFELIERSYALFVNDNKTEGCTVRQITGDGKNIYWNFIADPYDTTIPSGIKMIPATGTPTVSYLVEGIEVYGLAICNTTNSAVENIYIDNSVANAPVIYYNLQGIKVDTENLTPGIYIKCQGNNATKIIIK